MSFSVTNATVSDMTTYVDNWSVLPRSSDVAVGKTNFWINQKFSDYYGYYLGVPEAKAAIDTIAAWVVGDGYIANAFVSTMLDNIYGIGIDTFDEIIENMEKVSRINGDAFAEKIFSEESNIYPVNLKVLNPQNIAIEYNDKGIITGYSQYGVGKDPKHFEPNEIFHICNKRILDNTHGVSDFEAAENILRALQESFEDTQLLVHRNVVPLRVIEADTENATEMENIARKYEQLVKKREVLVIPKDTMKILTEGLSNNATFNPLPWRESLKNQFYQIINVPQILMGSAQEFSESSSKIALISFNQTIKQRQRYWITQIWNQIFMRLDMDPPVTIQNELISDTKKDGQKQQTGFQPSDFSMGGMQNA